MSLNKLFLFLPFFYLLGCSSTSASKKYSGFGLNSISTQTLAAYAPPPAEPELKNKIEKLIDLRAPNEGLVTNDGKALFFNWNVTGSLQIWKLQGPKSFPQQLTSGEDASRLVGISPDNQWIVISRDSKGDENPGLYLMKTSGGDLIKVYYNSKQQTGFLGFSKDSKFLFYRSNNKAPDSYAIYKYSLSAQTHETLWEQPGIWTLSDIQNNQVILSLEKGSMQNEHFLLDLNSKEKTPLIGQNENEDFDIAFSSRAGEYFVLTNKLSEFRRLYILKGKVLTPWSPENNADVSYFRLSENRQNVAYVINKNGLSQIHLVNAKNKKTTELPGLNGSLQQTLGSFSQNSRYLTYGGEFHNFPKKTFVYDLQSHRSQEWITPSSPEVLTENYVKPSLESYLAKDGTSIPMFVWRSEKCKKELCPVVVQFHGGPESQFTPRFSPLIQLYTEHNFVFVAPNVRGSDGYGKTWLHADDGVKRLQVITDIRDCADFIKKNWKINGISPKVGITGGSYGGYSTLVGVSKFADSYDAGLAIVGMSNLITFIENTAPYRRALRMNEYGDPSKSRKEMLELSPATYVEQVTQPLMIAHGATDPRVPVGEAVQFYELVQRKNKKSKLVIFPDEGHGVAKRPNIVLLNSYAIDFFEKTLK